MLERAPCACGLVCLPSPARRAPGVGQVGIRAEFSDAKHAFVATATQPIAKGSELLFYYGNMCRDAWINMYGFDLGPSLRACGRKTAAAKATNRSSKLAAKQNKLAKAAA